jgi:hypothetical protein
MASVFCRPCSISARKRAPNQATHLTFYADGTATLTCRRHTELALLTVAAFAFEFDPGSIMTPEQGTREELRAALSIGTSARRSPAELVEVDGRAHTIRSGRGVHPAGAVRAPRPIRVPGEQPGELEQDGGLIRPSSPAQESIS